MKNVFNRSLNNEEHNIFTATAQLLILIQVKVADTTIKKELLSHPNYLSLLSITESLEAWNIEPLALRITPSQLSELHQPFIAYLKEGRKFITITRVTREYVHYVDDWHKIQRLAYTDFLQLWDGIVLLAQPNERSGEVGYKNTVKKEWKANMRIPLILAVLFVAGCLKIYYVTFILMESGSLYFTGLLVCKMLGIIIACFLLWYEYEDNNALLQQICSVGKKTDCQAVLRSKGSAILGGISWSEIGFVYFCGGFFFLLLAGIFALPLLASLNLLSLPYVIFSLYYQAIVVKQWCVLCAATVAILLSELLFSIFTQTSVYYLFTNLAVPSFDILFVMLISFLFAALSWLLAKPYIYEAKRGSELQYQLARFKNNHEVFYSILNKQFSLQHSTEGLGIVIGNPDAKNKLIKVCNPYCGPCAKVHAEIEMLINFNSDWKVQIIFTADGQEDDLKSITVGHLMAIDEKSKKERNIGLKKKALDDWYHPSEGTAVLPIAKYDAFAEKYPLNGELKEQKEKIHAMHEWCRKTGITHTPTIFVNGYLLPEQYSIKDLLKIK